MLNRRDILLSGVSAAALAWASSAKAFWHGAPTVTGFSQRNVVNMGFQSLNSFAMINLFTQGGGNVSPVGASWSTTTDPWNRAIGANGWPNISEAGSPSFGGSWTLPGSDEFSGAYVFEWDGDGFIFENSNTTWTETNLVTPGGVTFTATNQNIPWTNTFSAGQPVVFDTTRGNVLANTTYYVSSAGLSTSNIRIADTKAHAIAGTNTITPNTSGSANLFGPYQKSSNGRWFNTNGASGTDAQIIVTPSGTTGPQNTVPVSFFETNQYGNGSFANNLRIYQQQDAADMAAGLLFRKAFKQSLVNLNPSAIRFMNWFEGGGASIIRFENRRMPGTVGVNGTTDWLQSPAYGNIAGVNQWTLTGVTSGGAVQPTVGNPKLTPVSDFNGEIVTCRMPTANYGVRASNGTLATVTAITNANPGAVTTNIPHGYQTGDKVVHIIPGNMPRLNYFPVTITVVDTTHYTIGIDTTSFGTFNNALSNQFTTIYLSLAVGGRNAYPIMQPDGAQPQGYSSNIAPSSNYLTFLFDQSSAGSTDGTAASFTGSISGTTLTVSSVIGVIAIGQTVGAITGGVAGGTKITGGSGTTWTVNISQTIISRAMTSVGWIYGAWFVNELGCDSYYPIEWCVALVNEVNALAASQGITNLTHCWLNTPVCALTATDPGYTTASDWGLGVADVATNPASTLRANGYSALGYSGATKLNSAQLFIELANELWNFNFIYAYANRRQNLRWPGTSTGTNVDWHAFQSSVMMHAIKAGSFGGNPIKCVLGGWAIASTTPLGFGSGYELINGNSSLNGTIDQSPGYSYTTDPYVIANSLGIPMNNHDVFAIAPYNDPPDTYFSSTGTGTFTDDSAMYAGTSPYSSPNQTQAITNFVNQMLGTPPLAGALATTFYCDATGAGQMTNYANLCKAVGKVAINYEGGTDWNVQAGGSQAGHSFTSADSIFATAVVNSSQWATAQVGYFNRIAAIPGAAMPSIYTFIGFGSQRWSYCNPDSFLASVEGAALTANPTWAAMGTRNQALPS